MFGHPVHALRRLCLHVAPSRVDRRWVRIAPLALMRQLPRLGCVLYLPGETVPGARPPHALLLGQAELQPLLRTCWLAAAGMVTTDGPYEWIECVDCSGAIRARLHLLPDTDYLAWDLLLAGGEAVPPPACWRGSRSFRPISAQLWCFRWRQLACLSLLEGCAASQVSGVGQRVAREVARAEALPLPVVASH